MPRPPSTTMRSSPARPSTTSSPSPAWMRSPYDEPVIRSPNALPTTPAGPSTTIVSVPSPVAVPVVRSTTTGPAASV